MSTPGLPESAQDDREVSVADFPGHDDQALITLPFEYLDTQAWTVELGVDQETLPLLREAIDAYTAADGTPSPDTASSRTSSTTTTTEEPMTTGRYTPTPESTEPEPAAPAFKETAENLNAANQPHRCGNCSGIDPDTCLMNPGRGGPVDLRTAVYRILNVEEEFVGCPSATTDHIMALVQDRLNQLYARLDQVGAKNARLHDKAEALEACYGQVAADAMAHRWCPMRENRVIQRAEQAEAARDRYQKAWQSARARAADAQEAWLEAANHARDTREAGHTVRPSLTASMERVLAELDRIAVLPTVDREETHPDRFSVGVAWAIRHVRAALNRATTLAANQARGNETRPGVAATDTLKEN